MSIRAEVSGSTDFLALHRQYPERYPFLLESVAGHEASGRFDLLFAFPGASLGGPGIFEQLSEASQAAAISPQEAGDLPFCGGWFLLLGYEAARYIEPRLVLPESPFALPDALAVRCPAALLRDRNSGRVWLYAESDPGQVDAMRADVASLATVGHAVAGAFRAVDIEEDSPRRYLEGIARIQEYLRAGDIFQANLSRLWTARIDRGDYVDLYRQLRRSNPAPFAGVARWGRTAILSSSPERLVQLQDGWVRTRPIAGTQPRSVNLAADDGLRQQLIGSLKERAEHLMLIDLERNDLGRVCKPGTVEVDELMVIESYAHVHHIVSSVRGRLRDGAQAGDVLRAVFPGGTITGCPKLRAMEVIAELEQVGRGPYTGSMGYLSRCGRMDSSILIRSIVVEHDRISLRAGGGIVADSRPEAELEETRAKARGLLLALDPA